MGASHSNARAMGKKTFTLATMGVSNSNARAKGKKLLINVYIESKSTKKVPFILN